MIADLRGIDSERASALAKEENARFVAERPRGMVLLERARGSMPRGVPMAWMDDLYDHPPVWVAEGDGAYFTDVDGHRYLDMYVADMSGFCGHAPRRSPRPLRGAMERHPVPASREDAITVAEHLAERYGGRSGSSRSRRPRRTPR